MQTFLPYPEFRATMECLDFRRLGKQRVEALQILRTLRGESVGWVNHPVMTMWRGYEPALSFYLKTAILEWLRRGYRNTLEIPTIKRTPRMPPWMGNEQFHASHRSNLLRKAPEWYRQFNWSESDGLEYVWPSSTQETLI